jgi:outer membrane protein assembly factor BamA
MGAGAFLRNWVAAAVVGAAPLLASAQGFAANYALTPTFSGDPGVGLTLQANRNWFGQLGISQGPVSALTPSASNDIVNVGGGYRWGNGQALSLQLSKGRGAGQHLGLSVNYDWPRYFVRFGYDQGLNIAPQDSLRFSAGIRF